MLSMFDRKVSVCYFIPFLLPGSFSPSSSLTCYMNSLFIKVVVVVLKPSENSESVRHLSWVFRFYLQLLSERVSQRCRRPYMGQGYEKGLSVCNSCVGSA